MSIMNTIAYLCQENCIKIEKALTYFYKC